MRILILTDRFFPEIAAPSFRVMEHAKVWTMLGIDVVVVTCAPNFPQGKVFPGYRNALFHEESIDGIRVIRLLSYMTANKGTVKRTLDYASFMFSAILQSVRFPSFDLILATSPPLFTAMAGWAIAKLKKRPWIFEVRDLWPASIKAVGAMNGNMLSALERLELFLYEEADHIITVTHSFKKDIAQRGIRQNRITIVENGVDTHFFNRKNVKFNARADLGVSDSTFLVGYVGTVGMAHGVETLVEAASLCRHLENITFVVIGEGAERSRIERLANTNGSKRLIIRDFVPHEMMPSYLSCLDAFVVHLRPDPVFRTVIPSKIFEALAMQLPLVHAVEGESAELVKEMEAGVCIPSGDARKMADAIIDLSRQEGKRKEMGKKGREAVKRKYSRSAKALDVLRCMENIVNGTKRAEKLV